jgi:DNA-binding NarL/FixJ family response regulator
MRIILADPSENLLSSLDFALLVEQDVQIVGKVMTVGSLQLAVQEFLPDLVILDWQMGKAHRQTLILQLHQLRPGLKVVAMVMHSDEGRAALAAGVDAIASIGDPPDWLIATVRGLATQPGTKPT